MKLKTQWLIFSLFFCYTFYAQPKSSLVIDSVKVKDWYNLAVENSDRKPKAAKRYLENIVHYVDSIYSDTPIESVFLQKTLADSYHFLSYFERRESHFDEALLNAQKSIKVKEKYELNESLAASYLQEAIVWIAIKDDEEALKTLKQAEKLAKRFNNGGQLLQIYSSYGSIYGNKKDTLSAIDNYSKSIALADSIGSTFQKASAYANYASFLRRIGRFEDNYPYLKKAMKLHEESNNKIGLESDYYALGVYYRHVNQEKQSIKYLKKAIDLNKEIQSDATLPYRYLALSKTYENIGDYKNAYNTYKDYKATIDKRNDIEKVRKMSKLDAQFELERKKLKDSLAYEKKLSITEAKIEQRATNRLWGVLTLVLVVITVGIYLYMRNREKLKHQAFQNILLKNKIATKSEEINELLSETMVHLKSKEKLVENLQKLSNEEEGVSLKNILIDLKATKADDEKLILIKQNIEKVNFEFIKQLKEKYPALTKTDIEICTYLRMGLERSEIARLRYTSIDAVKKSRNRIRKKMELSADVELGTYLEAI